MVINITLTQDEMQDQLAVAYLSGFKAGYCQAQDTYNTVNVEPEPARQIEGGGPRPWQTAICVVFFFILSICLLMLLVAASQAE